MTLQTCNKLKAMLVALLNSTLIGFNMSHVSLLGGGVQPWFQDITSLKTLDIKYTSGIVKKKIKFFVT